MNWIELSLLLGAAYIAGIITGRQQANSFIRETREMLQMLRKEGFTK